MEALTDRQAQVKQVIEDHIEEYGVSPTFREIGKAMGIASPNGVYHHIQALLDKGHLSAKGLNLKRCLVPLYESLDRVHHKRMGRPSMRTIWDTKPEADVFFRPRMLLDCNEPRALLLNICE